MLGIVLSHIAFRQLFTKVARSMQCFRRSAPLALLALVAAVPAYAGLDARSSNPADVAIAKRVALRITDFPAGWSQVPDTSKATGCFSNPLRRNSPTAFVTAKRFSSGENGTHVYQDVVVYGTAAGARRALSAVTAAPSFACYKAKLPAILHSAGLKLESFTGGRLSFDPLPAVVRAYRYKISASKSGQMAPLFIDYVFAVRGRILVSAGFTQPLTEPDVFIEHSVMNRVTARVPAP